MRFLSYLPTALFLFYVVLLSPFLALRKLLRKPKPGRPLIPKLKRFRFTAAYLLALTLLAIVAAATNYIHLPLRVSILNWILIPLVGACWGYFGARGIRKRAAKLQRSRALYAPTTPQELRWGLLTALCAGVGEEIIYRGVLFALMLRYTSSLILTLTICVVVFGMSHLPQGKAAAMAVGYIGLMFHMLFLITHTLAVPIGVHVIYDAVMFLTWYAQEKRFAAQAAQSQAVGQSA